MRPALGDKFLDLSPKAQPTKENINYSPSSKLKTCVVRDPVKRRKRQATKWEKHLHTTYQTKDSYLEYIKNSQNSTIKILLENGQKR